MLRRLLPLQPSPITVHELRTPRAAVLATLELLQTGALSTSESTELLIGATVATLHLDHLIDDILDEAALEAGQLQLHVLEHRVRDLRCDLARIMHVQADDRGLSLRVAEPDDDLRVHTDYHRFLQVALNLVGNALKFSPGGGIVDCRVEVTPRWVRFCVRDDGPGIPESAGPGLFLPFSRVNSDSHVRGTGPGLALCKQLIAQLRGQIVLLPRGGRGSLFWFELPRVVAEGLGSPR